MVGDIERDKRKEIQRNKEEAKQRQKIEEQEKISNDYPPNHIYDPHHEEEVLPCLSPQQKIKLDPNYYPPNYIPELEDAPILTNSLIPNLTTEKSRNTIQNEGEDKLIVDRRIVIKCTGEEDDLDYYFDSDYSYQTYI